MIILNENELISHHKIYFNQASTGRRRPRPWGRGGFDSCQNQTFFLDFLINKSDLILNFIS